MRLTMQSVPGSRQHVPSEGAYCNAAAQVRFKNDGGNDMAAASPDWLREARICDHNALIRALPICDELRIKHSCFDKSRLRWNRPTVLRACRRPASAFRWEPSGLILTKTTTL